MALQRLLVHPLMSRGDEPFEKRVRLVRFAVELRMKLAGDKEWVLRQLDDLNQLAIRSKAAEHKIRFSKPFAIGVIELVTMPMPFVHHECPIKPRGFCADH